MLLKKDERSPFKNHIIARGNIGYPLNNNIQWNLNNNGLLNIYGSGDAINDAYKSWASVKSLIKSVVISPEVKPSSMFSWFVSCINLTNINFIIPSSVTNMDFTFARCTSLNKIKSGFIIPPSVTNMDFTFAFCSSLNILPNSFSIPNSVNTMDSTFAFCSSLNHLPNGFSIPSHITNITSIFNFCYQLNESLYSTLSSDVV